MSSVLVASGRGGEAAARQTVRLSVGRETSRGEVERVVAALATAVQQEQRDGRQSLESK